MHSLQAASSSACPEVGCDTAFMTQRLRRHAGSVPQTICRLTTSRRDADVGTLSSVQECVGAAVRMCPSRSSPSTATMVWQTPSKRPPLKVGLTAMLTCCYVTMSVMAMHPCCSTSHRSPQDRAATIRVCSAAMISFGKLCTILCPTSSSVVTFPTCSTNASTI